MVVVAVPVVVVDMVMIVTVKAQGVVLPAVGVVHPAEGAAAVAIQEEVATEVEEDQVALHPVVEEVALVVDLPCVGVPEAVVLPRQKGSMVQIHSRLL